MYVYMYIVAEPRQSSTSPIVSNAVLSVFCLGSTTKNVGIAHYAVRSGI